MVYRGLCLVGMFSLLSSGCFSTEIVVRRDFIQKVEQIEKAFANGDKRFCRNLLVYEDDHAYFALISGSNPYSINEDTKKTLQGIGVKIFDIFDITCNTELKLLLPVYSALTAIIDNQNYLKTKLSQLNLTISELLKNDILKGGFEQLITNTVFVGSSVEKIKENLKNGNFNTGEIPANYKKNFELVRENLLGLLKNYIVNHFANLKKYYEALYEYGAIDKDLFAKAVRGIDLLLTQDANVIAAYLDKEDSIANCFKYPKNSQFEFQEVSTLSFDKSKTIYESDIAPMYIFEANQKQLKLNTRKPLAASEKLAHTEPMYLGLISLGKIKPSEKFFYTTMDMCLSCRSILKSAVDLEQWKQKLLVVLSTKETDAEFGKKDKTKVDFIYDDKFEECRDAKIQDNVSIPNICQLRIPGIGGNVEKQIEPFGFKVGDGQMFTINPLIE